VGEVILSIDDADVSQVRVDHSFSILFAKGETTGILRLGQEFEIEHQGARTMFHPDRKSALGPVLELYGRRVRHASADEEGHLLVEFEDGTKLSIGPNERYEAWEFTNAQGGRLVACVGGGLAVWSE
jgi:hypothetical protein